MNIIIDAILILVFIITIIYYHKIGFVKALFSVCRFFVAIAIAFSFASPLGSFISEKFIASPIQTTVTDKVASVVDKISEGAEASDILENLPGPMKFLVDSSDSLTNELNGHLEDNLMNDETVSKVSTTISEKISTVISCIIAFLILFAVSMILLTLLAFLLDKLCMLPVIKQANKLLGMLFGMLCGAFHAFAASTIITLVLHLIGASHHEFSVEAMKEKTVIYSFIQNIDLSHLIVEFLKDLI